MIWDARLCHHIYGATQLICFSLTHPSEDKKLLSVVEAHQDRSLAQLRLEHIERCLQLWCVLNCV